MYSFHLSFGSWNTFSGSLCTNDLLIFIIISISTNPWLMDAHFGEIISFSALKSHSNPPLEGLQANKAQATCARHGIFSRVCLVHHHMTVSSNLGHNALGTLRY
jgi:hypothetical protein